MKIISSFQRHLNIRPIARVFILMIVSTMLCVFLVDYITNIYQKYTKTSSWYVYENNTPQPVKSGYLLGEPLEFSSNINRFRSGCYHYEDTPHCVNEDGMLVLQQTQRRPETGCLQFKKGYYDANFRYYLPLDEDMVSCKLCGNTVGTTSLGYPKSYSFCTERFDVNQ